MENEESYISKKEAKKRGYVKRKGGGYYKKSVLEKYFEKGYLHLSDSHYCDEDRKLAGIMLAKDYYLGNFNNLQSKKFWYTGIITSGESGRDNALFFNERYLRAVKSIPEEFWHCVRTVCIEDKELIADKNIKPRTLLEKQNIYHRKMLLSLGLDRLIKFYLHKNKKNA